MNQFQNARYLPLLAYYQAEAKDQGGRYWESLAQVQAMLGQEAEALRSVYRSGANGASPYGPRPAWAEDAVASALTENALTAIAEAAKGRQIVILNEAHHTSRCRAFAQQVAEVLRKEGFTHFAAEAFANSPQAPGQPLDLTQVTADTGYFLHDPVFAQFVREIRRGWAASYAYEFTGLPNPDANPAEQIAEREEFQADVLADILKRRPGTRLFIYCGFSHAAKVQLGRTKWMAARLWEKTGIEPLTITQAFGTPAPEGPRGPEKAISPPGVEDVLAAFRPKASIVLRTAGGRALTNEPAPEGAYDLAVYHRRSTFGGRGRPDWLSEMSGRQPYEVKVLPPGPGLRLVQAFPKAELALDPNTLPVDQVLVDGGGERKTVTLWLRSAPEAHEFLVETPGGRA